MAWSLKDRLTDSLTRNRTPWSMTSSGWARRSPPAGCPARTSETGADAGPLPQRHMAEGFPAHGPPLSAEPLLPIVPSIRGSRTKEGGRDAHQYERLGDLRTRLRVVLVDGPVRRRGRHLGRHLSGACRATLAQVGGIELDDGVTARVVAALRAARVAATSALSSSSSRRGCCLAYDLGRPGDRRCRCGIGRRRACRRLGRGRPAHLFPSRKEPLASRDPGP